ncbi:MAG: hypothetical protein ACL93V_08445 [Candidatus Electrothrix sp. YB6]
MNTLRIQSLVQYILAEAAQAEDWSNRELGPIHIIKYLYLADMYYAMEKDGDTYTDIDWQFYHFGPWNLELYKEKIPQSIENIGADTRNFESQYNQDGVRWSSKNAQYDEVVKCVPSQILFRLRKDIQNYGAATFDLLHYVYATEPMRSTAPNEFIDFGIFLNRKKQIQSTEIDSISLSKRKQKKLKEKMRNLKELNKAKLAEKKRNALVKPPITPRYDDVYTEGIEWLESLAGPKIIQGKQNAVFSNSIWKSPARKGDHVSN